MLQPHLQDYFLQPTQTYQRQYEALRAVFVEHHKQKEVAQQFGYAYDSFRQLVIQFRQMTDQQRQDFFFAAPTSVAPQGPPPRTKPWSPTAES